MCYKKDKWEDAKDAIIKSSIILPKYCKRNADGTTPADWAEDTSIYEIVDRPTSFQVNGKTIEVQRDKLDYQFDLTPNVECYLQFFVKCN